MPRRLLPALFAIAILTPPAVAQDEHKIQLDYRPKAGDVIEVVSQIEQNFKGAGIAVNGGVGEQASRSGTFTIHVGIVDLDKKGRVGKATYKLVKYKGASSTKAFSGPLGNHMMGKTINVHLGEGIRRYLEPVPNDPGSSYVVDASWSGILDLAVPLKLFNEPTYDDLFGTAEAQKKGGSWTVAPEKLAAFYTRFGVPKEKVKSSATLKDVTAKKDAPLLRVEGKLEMTGLPYKFPDGFKQTDDKYELTFSTLVPAEGGLPVEQSIRRFSSVSGAGPKGKVAESTLVTAKAAYKMLK